MLLYHSNGPFFLTCAPMKKAIQRILQRLLGFDRYLVLFSWFKIKTLRWDGNEKEGDFNYFLELLDPADVVLDIGANIGIMTVLMARTCVQGKVYAFEPVPENFQALQRITRLMKVPNASLHPIALGAEPGELTMQMPVVEGVRMQGLSHIVHETIAGYETPHQSYSVAVQTLDDFPFQAGEKIAALKMDVENFEYFVLQGGQALLARDHPLIYCELWPNENRENCFDLLTQLGYEICVFQKGKLERFDNQLHTQHNFFFRFIK